MTRTHWLVLNLLLFAAATAATRAMLRSPTSGAAAAPSPADRHAKARRNPTAQKVRFTRTPANLNPHQDLIAAAVREIDDLWKHSLFRPERTEEVSEETGTPKTRTPEPLAQFELIGIGKIGERAAAIIWVKTPPPRRIIRRSPIRNRTTLHPNKNESRRVYMLGDAIGDTGYTLKEIKAMEVVIVKGDEEKVLKLDRADSASRKRNEEAARAEKNREKRNKTAAGKPRGTKPKTRTIHPGMPPPPPPPPPGPGIPAPGAFPPGKKLNTKAARMQAYRNRMLRALEARRQILQHIQAAKK